MQQKYVDLYDEIKNDDNKVLSLINNSSTSKYFYKPSVGVLQYIVDSEGHALYLINKSELPDEIKDVLVGGDAGNKEYTDYRNLKDVYGVTSNLKVYYCQDGLDSLYGLTKDELDNDNPLREVFGKDNSMSNVLSGFDEDGDGIINAYEAKSVKNFTIDKDSNLSSLKDLYNLVNLQEIVFDGVSFNNLDGLENTSRVYYIYFKNHCVIGDYSKLGSINNSLQYLYFFNTTDDEISKLCNGIASYDFEKLNYFGIVGNEYFITDRKDYDLTGEKNADMYYINNKSTNLVSDISGLKKLSTATKKAIKYLWLECNNISDISCLMDFENIVLIRAGVNNITSLHGLEKMNNLISLYVNKNDLGKNEKFLGIDEDKDNEDDGKNEITDGLASLKNKKNLVRLRVTGNTNLKWVDYIEGCSSLKSLYLEDCPNLNRGSVTRISKIWYNMRIVDKKINSTFEECFQAEDILNYKNLTESDSRLLAIRNLSNEDKKKVKKLDLSGSTLSNDTLQEILGYFPELICLNVNDCTNLSSFNFTSNTRKLEQILFLNTKITGDEVSKLDTYTVCKSYRCNNSEINLTKMQETISRSNYYTGTYSFSSIGNGIVGDNLIKQLEQCTTVTRLWALGISGSNSNNRITLDLGKMTLLNYIRVQENNNIDFVFSTHDINTLEWYVNTGNATVSIKDGIIVGELELNHAFHTVSYVDSIFGDDVSKDFTIDTLHFYNCSDNDGGSTNLIKKIQTANINTVKVDAAVSLTPTVWNYSEWGGTLNNIESLKIYAKSDAKNLDFLQNCTNLKTLIIKGGDVGDIDGIAGLTSLTTIDLSNNRIKNLYPLKNLNQLSSLTLSNNIIDDTNFEVVGESTKQNNLRILADLNTKGHLKSLYLDGNSGIIDFGVLQGLKWDNKKGF